MNIKELMQNIKEVGITKAAASAYIDICQMLSKNGNGSEISISELCENTGLNRRTAERALNNLEELQLISRKRGCKRLYIYVATEQTDMNIQPTIQEQKTEEYEEDMEKASRKQRIRS